MRRARRYTFAAAWLVVVVAVGAAGLIGPTGGGAAGTPNTMIDGRSSIGASHRAAAAPRPLRFAVIGDWGNGGGAEWTVAARMCRYRQRHPFDVVVTTGDNIYPDGRAANFRPYFFRPFRCLLRAGVQWRSTLGNHDVITGRGRPELKERRFGFRWQHRNYVLRRNGVLFVMANSNHLHRAWLRRALTPAPGDRWTVVAFHHPLFSPGPHGNTSSLRSLHRFFARRGVDLVLNGHDHLYAVTKPLRSMRYVVTGGGGAPLYGCQHRWFVAKCASRHHFLTVAAGAQRLVVRAVLPSGHLLHRFAMSRRR